jgi:hypothetical protein
MKVVSLRWSGVLEADLKHRPFKPSAWRAKLLADVKV